jgi:hypothetical protein
MLKHTDTNIDINVDTDIDADNGEDISMAKLDSTDGGEEYLRDQRLILQTLKDLKKIADNHTEQLSQIQGDLREQKIRAGFFGTIGGIISGTVVTLLSILKKW